MRSQLMAAVAAVTLTVSAHAQYTAKEWPEGPMKQRFAEVCGACHDINRIRVGYTPEGWLTVVRMMQNFDTPVPAAEWGAMLDYLITEISRIDITSAQCLILARQSLAERIAGSHLRAH